MNSRLFLYICTVINLLVTEVGAQDAMKGKFGSFQAGHTKGQMQTIQMDTQWPITQALAVAWSFRFKGSVCVLVRDGRVFLLGDDTRNARVHDLPVKPGDSFHRYSEDDVKAWNLPVYQEADTIRILKAEAVTDKARAASGILLPANADTKAESTQPAHPFPITSTEPNSIANEKSIPPVPGKSERSSRRLISWLAVGLITSVACLIFWFKCNHSKNRRS